MALQLDVGGSSTVGTSVSQGGNAGVTFAHAGLTGVQIVVVVALAVAAFYLFKRGR